MSDPGYSKRVKISDDNATFYELPVETPTLNINSAIQENTDLSNNDGFKSRIYGLNDFSVSIEGNFSPSLVYSFDIKKSGTSTAMTAEATSNTVGDSWQIDDAAKEVWDRDVALTFEDNAVAIDAADILSTDYLAGTVTFTSTKAGPITVATGNYIPLSVAACANQASVDLSIEVEEDTNIKTTPLGWKTRAVKLKDASISMTAFSEGDKDFFDRLSAREVVVGEITIGAVNPQIIRGWFIIESNNLSGGVADLDSEEISLQLDGSRESSFTWIYPTSGFDVGLKILTDYYFTPGDLYIDILPENSVAKGLTGPVVLESMSISLDVNSKATFSATLQGNGQLIDSV